MAVAVPHAKVTASTVIHGMGREKWGTLNEEVPIVRR